MKKNELKKVADNLMKIRGKIRGEAVLNRYEYIRTKKGDKGVQAVERRLRELGYPLDFKKLQSLGWFPEGNSVLIILAAQEIFEWNDNDIFEMGKNAPTISFMVKLLMKYFVSLEKTFNATPENWEKHHNIGSIELVKIDEDKKELIFRLLDYKIHPVVCIYLKGYFLQFAKLVIKGEEVNIEETKCMFKGDPYHEFKITWK